MCGQSANRLFSGTGTPGQWAHVVVTGAAHLQVAAAADQEDGCRFLQSFLCCHALLFALVIGIRHLCFTAIEPKKCRLQIGMATFIIRRSIMPITILRQPRNLDQCLAIQLCYMR